MGTVIVKNAVVWEPGFLYYINAAGDLMSAKMAKKGKAKSVAKKTKAVVKKVKAKKSK